MNDYSSFLFQLYTNQTNRNTFFERCGILNTFVEIKNKK